MTLLTTETPNSCSQSRQIPIVIIQLTIVKAIQFKKYGEKAKAKAQSEQHTTFFWPAGIS